MARLFSFAFDYLHCYHDYMPITAELDNINELEAVGFDHNQAKTITRIIEHAQFNSQYDLKEFIRNEFKSQSKELDIKITALENKLSSEIKDVRSEIKDVRSEIKDVRNELKLDIANLKADIMESQKDMLLKILGIVTAIVGLAVAIIKLF